MKHMSTSLSSQWLPNPWSIKFLRIVDLLLELCTRKCTVTTIHVFLSSIVIRQDRMHGLCVHVEWLCGIEWICDNDDIVGKTDISKYIDKFIIKSFITVSIIANCKTGQYGDYLITFWRFLSYLQSNCVDYPWKPFGLSSHSKLYLGPFGLLSTNETFWDAKLVNAIFLWKAYKYVMLHGNQDRGSSLIVVCKNVSFGGVSKKNLWRKFDLQPMSSLILKQRKLCTIDVRSIQSIA